jgi:formamidopyrimidine-DNA glycosylase
MPEGPEVEVARRGVERWLKRRTVVGAEAESKGRIFRSADRKAFLDIRGKLVRADRHGKYLLFGFSDGTGLIAHLGMTGKWVRRPADVTVPYSKARLLLDSGDVVHYRDPRMFGRIVPMPAQHLDAYPSVATLGPDLIKEKATSRSVRDALASSRQPLKVALMDQHRLAGLGNIHAAEALFRAQLSPKRVAKSLSSAEWAALARGINAALAFALKHEDGDEIQYVEEPGTPNPFFIYGRAQERCRRCATTVISYTQAGRTTHACPGCQR